MCTYKMNAVGPRATHKEIKDARCEGSVDASLRLKLMRGPFYCRPLTLANKRSARQLCPGSHVRFDHCKQDGKRLCEGRKRSPERGGVRAYFAPIFHNPTPCPRISGKRSEEGRCPICDLPDLESVEKAGGPEAQLSVFFFFREPLSR